MKKKRKCILTYLINIQCRPHAPLPNQVKVLFRATSPVLSDLYDVFTGLFTLPNCVRKLHISRRSQWNRKSNVTALLTIIILKSASWYKLAQVTFSWYKCVAHSSNFIGKQCKLQSRTRNLSSRKLLSLIRTIIAKHSSDPAIVLHDPMAKEARAKSVPKKTKCIFKTIHVPSTTIPHNILTITLLS